jgi:hypothetical protein
MFLCQIPVAARSEAWVCSCSLAGIVGSNPAGVGEGCECECCVYQVEVSTTGWSLIQRIPTECGVSECDREASIMRRHWHNGGLLPLGGKKRSFPPLSCYHAGANLWSQKSYGPKDHSRTHNTPHTRHYIMTFHLTYTIPVNLTVHVSTEIKATFMAKHTCGIDSSNIRWLESNLQNSILLHDLRRAVSELQQSFTKADAAVLLHFVATTLTQPFAMQAATKDLL